MRRRMQSVLLLALTVSLTACRVEFIPSQPTESTDGAAQTEPLPPDSGGTVSDVPDDPVTDGGESFGNQPVSGEEQDAGWYSWTHPDTIYQDYRRQLEGTWAAIDGEIEGRPYNLEEADESLVLIFRSADGPEGWSMGAEYDRFRSDGDREKLDGLHVKFYGGPLYDGCYNKDWYAELIGGPEDIEYTLTVAGGNALELRRRVKDTGSMWIAYCERADGRWFEG